jgi:hypothetical protein
MNVIEFTDSLAKGLPKTPSVDHALMDATDVGGRVWPTPFEPVFQVTDRSHGVVSLNLCQLVQVWWRDGG